MSNDDIVSDVVPLTVTAYGSERTDSFVIKASETPQIIPGWVWATLLAFVGWGAYYFMTALSLPVPAPSRHAARCHFLSQVKLSRPSPIKMLPHRSKQLLDLPTLTS